MAQSMLSLQRKMTRRIKIIFFVTFALLCVLYLADRWASDYTTIKANGAVIWRGAGRHKPAFLFSPSDTFTPSLAD